MAEYGIEDIHNFAKITEDKIEQIFRLSAIQLFKAVILKTPVDTGRARSNWQTEIGKFSKGEIDHIKNNEALIADMINKVNEGTIAQGYFLANNLPYIQKLEYGGYPLAPKQGSWDKKKKDFVIKTEGGFSKQAPEGMVRISLEEVKADLKRILEDVVRQK